MQASRRRSLPGLAPTHDDLTSRGPLKEGDRERKKRKKSEEKKKEKKGEKKREKSGKVCIYV